jgi:exodeoxyribonuclease (lambda-induced)
MDTQQGTPAWFNARRGKLTASNFGAAAGVNPYCSRKKALRQTLGLDKFSGTIAACVWGTKNEKNAIKDYMIRTGNVVHCKGLFTHPDYAWLGGSPDGLVGDDGIIEVKCPFYVQKCHKTIPPHYYCQVNGLMEIMDKKWCDYISWTPTEMKIYRVYRDSDCWAYLLDRYCVFYACMQRGCPNIPNMASAEKKATLARIAESDAKTDYNFWSALEPGNLKGKWDSPPRCIESEEDEETEEVKREIAACGGICNGACERAALSKRGMCNDGAGNIRKLPKCDDTETKHGPS